jgi:adenine-specific DNA-methyltransferase
MTEALEPEKLELTTVDLAAEKQAELLRLFPEVRTEGGKVDFDRLRLALGETVDVGKERYGMNWPGKADCFKAIQRPSLGTMLPVRKESVNFDETENLIIEGDNLEVLKLLQKSYQGKVKMIYIDPPYNTGNDFIYPDNYTENLQTYLEYTGQVDNEGHKFSNNTETDGRFHSKWMNMMYPRLYLARNLLSDEGVIFVSIDDSELCNLRSLMNEIFGEECFVSVIIVQANKRGQTYKEIAKTHEYLVVYSKNPEIVLYELEKNGEALPYSDSKGPFDLWELRNRNPKFGRFNRPNLFFPIYVAPSITDENGYSKIALQKHGDYSVEVWPRNSEGEDGCWRWGKEKLGTEDLTGTCPVAVAKQKRDGGWNIYERSRKSTTKAKSLWTESEVISEQGTIELGELGLAEYFEHPKPVELLKKCVRIGANGTDLVLDFFAGSGTMAQAVFEVNSDTKSNLRFLLVQLPEPTNIKEFPTIADITKERVRRVIQRHEKEAQGKLKLGDEPTEGFRVMKLTTSNFKVWNAGTDTTTPETLGQQLELHISHVQEGRSSEDLLTEILFKNSFPLTTPVQSITVEGIAVYSVANGAMLICLDKALTHEAIKGMAELKPERVVCLDEGFAGNDQLKTNAVLIMKAKGVTKFQTV